MVSGITAECHARCGAQEPGIPCLPDRHKLICRCALLCLGRGGSILNSETMSAEAKIGRILILVSVIIGIFAVIILGSLAVLLWPSGGMNVFGIMMLIPLWILAALVILKLAGLALGITAPYYTGRGELTMAGILAAVSSVLPPLELIILIGGIFCLIIREANEPEVLPPPP